MKLILYHYCWGDMIKDLDIICLSTVPWDYLKIANQQTMIRLARENRVLFIERPVSLGGIFHDKKKLADSIKLWKKGIRYQEGLYTFMPPPLFPWGAKSLASTYFNSGVILNLLPKLVKKLGFKDPILYSYLPYAGLISDHINKRAFFYDVIDEHSAFPFVNVFMMNKLDKKTAMKASAIMAISHNLVDKRKKWNPNTFWMPIGAETELFAHSSGGSKQEKVSFRISIDGKREENIELKRPIIGYYGGIDTRFDTEMVYLAAQNMKKASFILVGPINPGADARERLSGLSNVFFPGPKPYKEIPNWAGKFDICILPYIINQFTRNIFPNKLFEYLATGKPVISSPIPSVSDYADEKLIYIAENPVRFLEKIQLALKEDNEELAEKRMALARANTWDIRVEDISTVIEGILEKRSGDWIEKSLLSARAQRVLGLPGN